MDRYARFPDSRLVLLLALLLAACGRDAPVSPDPPPDSGALSVSPARDTTTALDETAEFTATLTDEEGRTVSGTSVAWSTTDEAVATVDDQGAATALAVGETEVVASDGEAADTATLVVTQEVASVDVRPDSADLTQEGDTVRFVAEARDANGYPVADVVPGWSSSDTAIAVVGPEGLVTARQSGEVSVRGRAGGLEDVSTVRVELPPPPIALVGVAENLVDGDSSTEASITVDRPEGVEEGDLMIVNLVHGNNGNPGVTPPDGWKLIHDGSLASGESGAFRDFYRVAAADEPSTYTFRIDPDRQKHPSITLLAYRNTDGTIAASALARDDEGSDAPAAPSVEAPADGSLLLCLVSTELKEDVSYDPPGSMSERFDKSTGSHSHAGADRTVSSGATGPRSFDASHSGTWIASSLVLTPEGGE